MNRCAHPTCNKKLNLMKFTCQCQLSFCLKHKSPETHSCTYDYKTIENLDEKISLSKCIAEKIKSI